MLQPTDAFGKGYKLGMYALAMEYSVFAPCPAGNAIETIRLFEALELGCIPITLDHPFLDADEAFAGMPAPRLKSWDQLPEFLAEHREAVHSAPDTILQMQRDCLSWWTDYKIRTSQKIDALFRQLRQD